MARYGLAKMALFKIPTAADATPTAAENPVTPSVAAANARADDPTAIRRNSTEFLSATSIGFDTSPMTLMALASP